MTRQGMVTPFGSVSVERGSRERVALMTAIFGKAEAFAVGKPGQLARELVAAARRSRDSHRKTLAEQTNAAAFEPADMVDISDNEFANLRRISAIIATPPGDILIVWQEYSWRFCSMYRPVSATLDALMLTPLLIEREDANRTFGL